MRRMFILLLALIFSAKESVFPQANLKRVAVSTFDVVGNVVTQEDAEAITELYITELVNTGKVSIYSRKDFDKILAELQFQSGDWSSPEKTVQLQQATGATVLGRGQIFKLGSSFYISATMIDANSAEILSGSKKSFKNIDKLVKQLGPMAKEVTKDISRVVMKYQIGDTGPGGGIVFYVSEAGFDVFDGKGGAQHCNYLEVSKEEIGLLSWCYHSGCGVTGSAGIGYGKSNTYKIIERHSDADSENCAAYACYKYKTPTTSEGEWFLPSIDELNLMYENVRTRIASGASSDWYWSSTPVDKKYAMVQKINGSRSSYRHYADDSKNEIRVVRAVRAFSN